MAAFGRHHKRGAAASGRGTSFVVSFVVAMKRVDVVDLVVDLVDVDLDVDLVDVDLDVVPFCGCCPEGGLDFTSLELSFDALDRLYRPD